MSQYLTADESRPILRMENITKKFPGILALDEVDFSVFRGEIHSLIGQNGAGKSTLMKILAGDYPSYSGQIYIDDQPVKISNNRESKKMGIGIVYQELSLLPNLTVAENIFLGREPMKGIMIDQKLLFKKAEDILHQLGIHDISVGLKIEQLPLAEQQLVEIAKVLSAEPKILILDEPTAPLSEQETDRLFQIIRKLKAQGIAVIFITHRFKEIIQYCDKGTVLRNGQLVKEVSIKDIQLNELIELMLGQSYEGFYGKKVLKEFGDVVFEADNVSVQNKVKNINFQIRKQEIVGITGLLGAGQNELARAMFGIQENVTGAFKRFGKPIDLRSPKQAIEAGICLLTENRKEEGLLLNLNVKENMTLPSLRLFWRKKRLPIISNERERDVANQFVDHVNIKTTGIENPIRLLSGGNQQKSILARWLIRNLDVLIFIEPTRGIDVGAKSEIYRYLEQLALQGKSIIVVSTDIQEILSVSDRVLVMYKGEISNSFTGEVTEELLQSELQGGNANG